MKKFTILFLFCFLNGESISPSLYSWFSALKLSHAGGGNLILTPSSRTVNPANSSLNRSFSTSFVLYPAGIEAQSASILIPQQSRLITAGINHIFYGAFNGYDENAIPTNNYSSSDTWVRIGYSDLLKNYPVRYGISNQIYFSKLAEYSSTKLYFSLGAIWNIKKYKTYIGLSINDFSINIRSDNNIIQKSPLRYNIGICKKLIYLPLKISIDFLSITSNRKDYFISGIFSITKNLSFSWGTSTRKFSQNTNESVSRTILGSTGAGISFKENGITIGYGLYFYGTGGWANGLDLSINF